MYINKVKKYLFQYVTKEILNQNSKGIIYHNQGHKLITDFLIDLLNSFYQKYLRVSDDNEITLRLSSEILQKKYGRYALYLNYLIDKEYISNGLPYIAGERCTEYKLNIKKFESSTFIDYKNYDSSKNKRLLKFYNDPKNFISHSTIIDKDILHHTIDNINHIAIDYNESISFLKDVSIDKKKYLKNLDSIKRINHNQIYMTPDKYGRVHTNFTILKKEIRNKYLFIDGESISEIDIKNSQPFFLLKLIADNLHLIDNIGSDLQIYFDRVVSGKYYEYFQEKNVFEERDEVKEWVYKLYFGKPYPNKIFENIFPTISQFMNSYKKKYGYKELSHKLQNIESEFIFNRVCRRLAEKQIIYFTVHDSVNLKESDYIVAKRIFDEEFNNYKVEVKKSILTILNSN